MALESGNGRSSGKCPLTSNGYHLHSRRCCPHLTSFCDVSKKCYRCYRYRCYRCPREPRLLMQTWLPICHYKTALSRLQVYRPKAGNFCRRAGVQLTRLPTYGRIFLPSRGYMGAALLQRCCSGSFSNCIQVLCSHLQWQDRHMAIQASLLLLVVNLLTEGATCPRTFFFGLEKNMKFPGRDSNPR
jgi:hypothetical protein